MILVKIISKYLVLMLIFTSLSVAAQDVPSEHERPIFVMKDGIISQWDITQRTPNLVTDLHVGLDDANPASLPTIFQIQMDKSASYVYRTDILSANVKEQSFNSRLVRVDLKTNKQTILMERADIFEFYISPDGNRVLVMYFENGAKSRLIPCMLDLISLQCTQIDFSPVIGSYAVWLDDQTIALRARPTTDVSVGMMLINAESIKTTFISLPDTISFISFAPIPGRRDVIFSANLYNAPTASSVQFYTLNIDTQVVQNFAYDTSLNDSSVTAWLFSPNGHYLFYGNLGEIGNMALVEFETGRIIGIFPQITQATWIDNNRFLILNGFGKPPTLSEVSATSGESNTIISDATGIVILN